MLASFLGAATWDNELLSQQEGALIYQNRAELGKLPMIIDINKKILNYLDYLRGKDEDSIVKQALQISIDLHHNGKTSFYSNLMKMVDYYDLNYDFSCNSLSDSIVNRYIGIMKNKYVS